MTMLPKKQMSEEDIKLQFITPAITAKWDISKITKETKLKISRNTYYKYKREIKRGESLI